MKEDTIKLVLLVALCSVLFWLYTRPSMPEPIPYKAPPPPRPDECLLLSGVAATTTGLTFEITGLLENTCGRPFAMIGLTYTVMDASDAIVGTALASQANIGIGEKWRFRAVAFAAGTRYRLESLTAH